MNLAWKFMLPMALINILAVGIWRFMGEGVGRWLVCTLLIAGAYVVLGKALSGGPSMGKRIYRYAD